VNWRRGADCDISGVVKAAIKSDEQLARHTGVRLCRWLVRQYVQTYHDVSVPEACPLPQRGPAIIVCNHVSSLDPVLVQYACPRVIVWMMAREFYEMRALRWFYRMIDAIPVDRSGRDLGATRAALRALEAGRVLGVFPEGRISEDGRIQPLQTGVALLAIRSGAAVFPMHLSGSLCGRGMLEAYLLPMRARVTFGRPLSWQAGDGARQTLDAATLAIRNELLSLQERATEVP